MRLAWAGKPMSREEIENVSRSSRDELRFELLDLLAMHRMPARPDGDGAGGVSGGDAGGGVADEDAVLWGDAKLFGGDQNAAGEGFGPGRFVTGDDGFE